MADGDLTLRIEDTSPDESGRVGQAFDQMAGQLQDSLQALKAEKGRVEALLHARRDLVANISHDLRTPIASLAVHPETLSEHPERLDAYLPILSDETDRVSGLIGDLFELARLDVRELELDLSLVALCDVIERVVTTYKRVAWEQRRIVLEADLPPTPRQNPLPDAGLGACDLQVTPASVSASVSQGVDAAESRTGTGSISWDESLGRRKSARWLL